MLNFLRKLKTAVKTYNVISKPIFQMFGDQLQLLVWEANGSWAYILFYFRHSRVEPKYRRQILSALSQF